MAVINDTNELTVEIAFNQCADDSRAEIFRMPQRLYEQPGTKLKLTLAFGDVEDMFGARDEIDELLAARDPTIAVKYAWKGKDTGATPASPAVTPMERAIRRMA